MSSYSGHVVMSSRYSFASVCAASSSHRTLYSTRMIYVHLILFFFFFFSSRRRHTRSTRDWSSDVCSSDLGGHALLEGVPGLGKTMLVRTLSQVLDLKFSRVQFTPDLMPADILGTNIISEAPDGRRAFSFQPGPLFAQIVLADEINRATPKTQSALLEAMQEHSITIGGTVHRLVEPFFVLATQNPIEQEGTYPLPEAQLDRFFFKLIVNYSGRDEMSAILDRTTKNVWPTPERVMNGPEILQWQSLIREVLLAPPVQDYAIRLVMATHPQGEFAAGDTNRFLRFGASPL